ncbi:MAG: hypothetical protein M1826_004055 [Phylliscum demangeonii]|nr:MAG: hypothetical protein M1826_004055 [Phylliscum demangeonii]
MCSRQLIAAGKAISLRFTLCTLRPEIWLQHSATCSVKLLVRERRKVSCMRTLSGTRPRALAADDHGRERLDDLDNVRDRAYGRKRRLEPSRPMATPVERGTLTNQSFNELDAAGVLKIAGRGSTIARQQAATSEWTAALS